MSLAKMEVINGIGAAKTKNVNSLFKLFRDLTGEKNQNPKFCLELIKCFRNEQCSVGSDYLYSIKRIVRGLGSTRSFTQCGCFATLTCILKYRACSVKDVLEVLKKIRKGTQDATKSEMGAYNSSYVLTCGAIIHSGTFLEELAETQRLILIKLIEAGKKKTYLFSVACRFLVDIVLLLDGQQFKEIIWPVCKELVENLNECNADTLNFLIVCREKHPKIINKFLIKNSYSSSLFAEKIFMFVLHNFVPSNHPVYESISHFLCNNTEVLVNLWTQCINECSKVNVNKDGIFITLFAHIMNNLQDPTVVPCLLVPKFIEILIRILSFKKTKDHSKDNNAASAKSALNCMITLLNKETTSNETRFESIKKLLFYPANMKFDMKTGSKCIYSLSSNLSSDFIKKLLDVYKKVIAGELKKIIDENGSEENWNNKERQHVLHIFVKALNHPSLKNEFSWKLEQIKFIFGIGFLKKFQLPSEVQSCAKESFYKAVTLKMPSLKDLVFVLDELAEHVNENMKNESLKVSEEIDSLWSKMFSVVQKLRKKSKNKLFIAVHVLLIYMGLQLFLDSELAKEGIDELLSCYEHLRMVHDNKKRVDGYEEKNNSDLHWTEVTVDLILSLLSRENKLWRHVVSCIFPQVVTHITPTALHQIIDALDPKSQNKVLNHVLSDNSDSEESSEEGSEISLTESEESGTEEGGDEGNMNDQLRLAVRNALGYSAALTDDESIDMDQMDEQEEKRLNESLAEAFKLFKPRSKGKKKKQTKEEEALTHFRLRVLDLVEIYVMNAPSMGGCLDLLLPLLDVLELSIKDSHQRPLQSRVDSVLKHISAVRNFSNLENVTQSLIKDLFESVIARKEISALIFVEMSPRISDCTTFLVRCSQMIPKVDSEIPLVDEYISLLRTFIQSRDVKLPVSIFQTVMRTTWMGNIKIVGVLFEFLSLSNVRIFKKMKIIDLLIIFYKNDKIHFSCDNMLKSELNDMEKNFIDEFINLLSHMEKNELKLAEKMYLSFFSNILILLNVIYNSCKRHSRQSDGFPLFKNLILKMAQLELVSNNKKTRSQLTNLANIFKIDIPMKEIKRERITSESSIRVSEADEEGKLERGKKRKKKFKNMSAEKRMLMKESRKIREKISSNGLELVKFSEIDLSAIPEPDVEEVEDDEVQTNKAKRRRFDCRNSLE